MTTLDLYSDTILEIAANPPATPRLAHPSGSARKVARVCGSAITVDLVLEAGRVTAYGAEVKACALGQTSAAIMARHIVGETPAQLRGLRGTMRAMLGRDGPVPEGRWADLACLVAVRDYPARHASTLLVFDAVVEALDRAGA